MKFDDETGKASAVFVHVFQLPSSIGEVWIDPEGGFKFFFGFRGAAGISQSSAQFVMCDVVIRADRQALVVEIDSLLAIGRQLGFVEIVAESAVTILLDRKSTRLNSSHRL